MESFWNSLDNAPISIVFFLEMKVKVEVGVEDIRSRLTPRSNGSREQMRTVRKVSLSRVLDFESIITEMLR